MKDKEKDITLLTIDPINQKYIDQLHLEKVDVEELVDDTQRIIDGKIRNISSRLNEKEKQLERIEAFVRSKLQFQKSNELETIKQEYEVQINNLKYSHNEEVIQMKNEIEKSKKYLDELEKLKQSQKQDADLFKTESTKLKKLQKEIENYKNKLKKIDELQEVLKSKNEEIKSKDNELVKLQNKIKTKESDIISLNDQLLLEKSKMSKETKDIKQELEISLKEIKQKDEVISKDDKHLKFFKLFSLF